MPQTPTFVSTRIPSHCLWRLFVANISLLMVAECRQPRAFSALQPPQAGISKVSEAQSYMPLRRFLGHALFTAEPLVRTCSAGMKRGTPMGLPPSTFVGAYQHPPAVCVSCCHTLSWPVAIIPQDQAHEDLGWQRPHLQDHGPRDAYGYQGSRSLCQDTSQPS